MFGKKSWFSRDAGKSRGVGVLLRGGRSGKQGAEGGQQRNAGLVSTSFVCVVCGLLLGSGSTAGNARDGHGCPEGPP